MSRTSELIAITLLVEKNISDEELALDPLIAAEARPAESVTSVKIVKARAVTPPTTFSIQQPGCSKWLSRSDSGGNPVCPRPSPKWQTPITDFQQIKNTKMADRSSDEDEYQDFSKGLSRRDLGGNLVCPRASPELQEPITDFQQMESIKRADWCSDDAEFKGQNIKSLKRMKMNEVNTDEEDTCSDSEMPILVEPIDLERLTGENCHKLEKDDPEHENKKRYKGKGVGKKSKKITEQKD